MALKLLVVIHVQLLLVLVVVLAAAPKWLLVIHVQLLLVPAAVLAVAPKWLDAIHVQLLLQPAIAVADVVRRRAADCCRRSSLARRSLLAMRVHAMHVQHQLLAALARLLLLRLQPLLQLRLL